MLALRSKVVARPFPIYTLQTGSKRNARESNAILGLNAHSSFNSNRCNSTPPPLICYTNSYMYLIQILVTYHTSPLVIAQ